MTRRFWILALVMAVFAAVLAAGCGGGGDDDDDDDSADDDDSGDDDSDDDATDDDSGDDDTQEITVSNLSVGSCDTKAAGLPDPATEPHDMVEVDWIDGVLTVHRPAAIVNCGASGATAADLAVDASVSGSTINVGEVFSGSIADCTCSVDMSYDIEGIEPGNYSFSHNGYSESAGKSASAGIADFDVTLDAGMNWSWGVPLVDTLTGLSGPYDANTDISLIVSPCYLEDKESVQVSHRVGWTDSSVNPGVWFIVHDKRNVDEPGETDDVCILFNYTIEGGLDAGSYTFFATSFDFRDTGSWTLLERETPIVVE